MVAGVRVSVLGIKFTCRLTAWGINPHSRTGPSVSYFFLCALGSELTQELS